MEKNLKRNILQNITPSHWKTNYSTLSQENLPEYIEIMKQEGILKSKFRKQEFQKKI